MGDVFFLLRTYDILVGGAGLQELFMAALTDDFPVGEDDDLVGMGDGTDALGDDEDGGLFQLC